MCTFEMAEGLKGEMRELEYGIKIIQRLSQAGREEREGSVSEAA